MIYPLSSVKNNLLASIFFDEVEKVGSMDTENSSLREGLTLLGMEKMLKIGLAKI